MGAAAANLTTGGGAGQGIFIDLILLLRFAEREDWKRLLRRLLAFTSIFLRA